MHVINTYNSLLDDVSHLSGVRLHAPMDLDMAWVRIGAPALDKSILQDIETGSDNATPPQWLMPLYTAWKTTKSPTLLRYLRQLLLFGYKTEEEPTHDQLDAAQAAFVEIDTSLDAFRRYFIPLRGHSGLVSETRKLVSRVIHKANFYDIEPTHGPGAVFPPRAPWEKSRFIKTYDTIERYYGFYDYFVAGKSLYDYVTEIEPNVQLDRSISSRLVAVPKDSRGPRLICVHPCEAMWIQQGIRRVLERCIESSPLTRGRINFTDQRVNGNLALSSSRDGYYATIDLKDASDRLDLSVVSYLFGSSFQYLNCCRARSVQLLDRTSHVLRKYAPMGNATVFPVQSLIFWAVATAGIRSYYGINCSEVYVFGDDIIVPTAYYYGVIMSLVRFGLVPNPNKCFHRGSFRESCGVDAYCGVDVTPVRLRRCNDVSHDTLVSLCATAKSLRIHGYENAAASIYSHVRRIVPLHLCNNHEATGIYEYVSYSWWKVADYEPSTRWNKKLHRYEVRTLQRLDGKVHLGTGDRYHLLDWFCGYRRSTTSITSCKRGNNSIVYPDPYRYRYKYGWTHLLPEPCGFGSGGVQ